MRVILFIDFECTFIFTLLVTFAFVITFLLAKQPLCVCVCVWCVYRSNMTKFVQTFFILLHIDPFKFYALLDIGIGRYR